MVRRDALRRRVNLFSFFWSGASPSRLVRSMLIAGVVLPSSIGSAATVKWVGGSGTSDNWTDTLNWLGFDRPNNDGQDTVRFAGDPARKNSIVNQGYNINELKFEYDDVFGDLYGSSFTVGGSSWIGVQNGISNKTDLAQVVNAPVQFNASGSIVTGTGNSGSLTINRLYLNGHFVSINALGGPINITGEISGGEPNTNLAVSGGVVTFSGNNTWFGSLSVGGGTLVYGGGPNIGSIGVTISLGGDAASPGRLRRTTSGTTVAAMTVSGESEIEIPSGLTVTHSGPFGGVNSGTLSKSGTGTLILNNTLSYVSNTNVAGGILRLEGSSLLPDRQLSVASGATIQYAAGKDDIVAGIAGGGLIALEGNTRLQVGSGATLSGAGTFLGSIQGTSGRFVKAGVGTLNLMGASSFGGGTTLTGGTLLVNNTSGSATGNGAVLVSANTTLGGDGAIGGAVTIESGGVLAPSSSGTPAQGIGSLAVSSLAMNAGSNLAVELGPESTFDQVNASGNVTLNGTLALSRYGNIVIADVARRRVLTTQGTLGGTFANIAGQRQSDTQWFAVIYGVNYIDIGLATPGDSSLDGRVDFADLLTLAQHYSQGTGQSWITGDFTGDSGVGFEDLLILAQHYGQSFVVDWALARSIAPEPTGIAILSLVWMTRRRCRRNPMADFRG